MHNVTIVSVNDELSKKIARELAYKLKYDYVDISAEFDKVLILNVNCSVFENSKLEQKESCLIKRMSQKEACVLAISNDMFLSNNNYNLLENSQKILIECEFDDAIVKNVERLIKKHTNFHIKSTELEKIITLLKG